MKLVSWGGISLDDANTKSGFPVDGSRDQFRLNYTVQPRAGNTPILTALAFSERVIPVHLHVPKNVNTPDALDRFQGFLLSDPFKKRVLIAQRHDGTNVQRLAIVSRPSGPLPSGAVNGLAVEFVSEDPEWRVSSPAAATTVNPTMTDSPTWSAAVPYTALGASPIAPLVTINPGAPSSGTAPTRYSFTWKNGEDHPIEKLVWRQPLGSTAGWTGSTPANTYLFCDGIEVPRQVVALGEVRSFIDFVVDFAAEGQTKTYEIITGGTVAGVATAPKELVGTDGTPIPDLGWEVRIMTSSVDTFTIRTGLITGPPAQIAMETNRWKYGIGYVLTGPQANFVFDIASNDADDIINAGGFPGNPYAASARVLLVASSYLNNSLQLTYASRLTVHPDYPHGLWHGEDLTTGSPRNIRYDFPASWQPIRSMPNDDDVSFYSASDAVGDHFTTPNISRTWQGGDDNSNRKERGGGDGVTISFPVPITHWRADYQFKNPNGVGKAIFASRGHTAESWTLHVEDTTIHATLTDIGEQNISFPVETRHLLFALWPAYGDAIPTSWAKDSGGRSGGGYTTLTDDSKTWKTNQWVGARMRITSGKGQGISRTIISNDANTLTWSTAIPTDDLVPNDGSRYEVVNPALIANIRSNDVWTVTLDVSKITVSAITSLGAAERVALRLRANGGATGTTPYVRIDVGADERALWVSAGDTVEVNCDAQTAYVMNGSTVVKDVTDWVIPRELEAAGGTVFEDDDWLPIIPGSGNFYVQRTGGVATASTSVSMPAGYYG